MAVRPAHPEQPDHGRTPESVLALTRHLLAELHPGVAWIRPVTLDSALERDLGLDSLSRVELAVRVERAFGVTLPEKALAEVVTLRDLLAALRDAPDLSSAAAPAAAPARWSEPTREFPHDAATLVEALGWHVRAHPDRVHIVCVGDGVETQISYRELHRQVEFVAAGLQRQGLEPRQTVAIMLPTSPEYFHTYLGILLAGGIPVPIYPPARMSQIEEHVRRHAGILSNAEASILVTVPEARGVARLLEARVAGLRRVVTVAELKEGQDTPRPVRIGNDDIAFIQYTSGSTGDPKGVVLTHGNLMANIRAMGEAVDVRPDDVLVSWLPLYHDMGLISMWLTSLYFAIPLVVMSPLAFLARPERWLRAIQRYRGTISAAPNFAYELCVKRIDDGDLDGLDLHSWRMACNGAEPVLPETMHRFTDRFARYGFQANAMTPVYGLAECTVGLLCPPLGRGARVDRVRRQPFSRAGRAEPAADDDASALRFVSCGRPLPGHEVRIVDALGHAVGERVEGRLEFRGPSATARLLSKSGADGSTVRRRLARHRGPCLRRRRRGASHRPRQGHRHPRRAQHLSARGGGCGGHGARRAPGLHRRVRQPRSRHRHRAPGGAGRDPRYRRGGAQRAARADRRGDRRGAGRTARRGRAGATSHGAQDVERQDPPCRVPRALRERTRRRARARRVVAGDPSRLRRAAAAGAACGDRRGGTPPRRPVLAGVRDDRAARVAADRARADASPSRGA